MEEGGSEEGLCECEDGGGFAGAWWTVEEHVGQVVGLHVALESGGCVVLSCYVGEGFWAAEQSLAFIQSETKRNSRATGG